MSKVESTDGFILHGWMTTELHLSGGDLVTFALVHQFSQLSKAGQYIGGPSYLASWMGWTYATAHKHLKSLVKVGLIDESKGKSEKGEYCYYKVSPKILKKISKNYIGGSIKTIEGVSKKRTNGSIKTIEGGIQKLNTDSNTDSKVDNKENNIGEAAFSFYDSLLALGVTPQTAKDWMAVRKTQRATNTLTSFKRIKSEIERSDRSAEECIRIATEKQWRGFEASWLDKGDHQEPDKNRNSKFSGGRL